MEKQSVISNRQLISLLIMTRLPFSTAYIPGLAAGRSVQDILLAVPVNFLLNFIIALPFLALCKRHPGKDPVECAFNILGKGPGILVAIYYMLLFLLVAVNTQANFELFYVNAIKPESSYYAIAIPMMLLCFYGAIKGIEAIVRFGGLVLVVYLIIVSLMLITLIPSINPDYLFPLFYNGPQYFLKAVLSGFNSNYQIVILAFCLPFLKTNAKAGKIFTHWNVITFVLFLLLELEVVTIMGPFGAKQNFPLYTLSTQSAISPFERLDQVDMISWILNTVLIITATVYLASMCLLKCGLNHHRRLITFIIAAVVTVATQMAAKYFVYIHVVTISTCITVITVISLIVIPLLLLLADLVKGRVQNAEQQGSEETRQEV